MSSSTSTVILTIFHFVIFLHYSHAYWFYFTDTKEKLDATRMHTYGGEYKFLTIWNLLLQLFFFFWSCMTDLISTSAGNSYIGRKVVAFRDWLLAALAFPIGTLVVTTFWGIYSIDRELIFPDKLDRFFPPWLNHSLHTFVLPLLLVDMLLVRHKYPSRLSGFGGTIFFGMAYLLWILYLGFVKDLWVYPFMEKLEGSTFLIFFGVEIVVVVLLYFLGEKLNNLLGGSVKEASLEKID